MSVARPDLIMKSIIPVVMAGIIAIYGLVVAALVANAIKAPPEYSLYQSVHQLSIITTHIQYIVFCASLFRPNE